MRFTYRVEVPRVDEPGAALDTHSAATRRTSGAALGSATIQTVWPGWMFAPTPTISSA